MSLNKEVLTGSFFLFLGTFFAAIIAYFTKLLLARSLSPEDFGLFFAVLTFVLFFTVFTYLGLGGGLAKFIPVYKLNKEYGKIHSIITGSAIIQLICSLIVVLGIWLSSGYLAENFFGNPNATLILKLLSLYLPLSIIYMNIATITNAYKFKYLLSFSQLSHHLFILLITLLFLYLGFSILSPVLGYLLSFIVYGILFTFLLWGKLGLQKKDSFFDVNKKLILFSVPIMLTGIGAVFINHIDILMITYFLDVTDVGIYNVAFSTAMMITMAGGVIGTIMLPIISELWEKKEKHKATLQNTFSNLYKYLSIIILPILLSLSIISEPFIRILFGEFYTAGVLIFEILLIATFFKLILTLNYKSLIGFGASKGILYLYSSGAVINIILNLILIPKFGLVGAGIATIITFIAICAQSQWYLFKIARITLPFITITKVFISTLSIYGVVWIFWKIPWFNIYTMTIIGLIIGGGIYLLLLLLLKVIGKKDYDFIRKEILKI